MGEKCILILCQGLPIQVQGTSSGTTECYSVTFVCQLPHSNPDLLLEGLLKAENLTRGEGTSVEVSLDHPWGMLPHGLADRLRIQGREHGDAFYPIKMTYPK